MNNQIIRYTLTPAALARLFVETGKHQLATQRLDLDTVALTPEQRQILVDVQRVGIPDSGFLGGIHLAVRSIRPAATTFFNKVQIASEPYTWDAAPTVEQVFEKLQEMIQNEERIALLTPQVEAELKAIQEQRKAEREAADTRARVAWEAEAKAREAQAEAERQARMVIPWDGDTAIVDLKDALFAAADVVIDTRFNSWARTVTGINMDANNGFTFLGDFVDRGTVEISGRDEKRVYLVAGTHGSRRNQTTEYRVILMVGGQLIKTEIETNDSKPGWALRIRKDVADLLK